MTDREPDPVLEDLRARITEIDREIFAAINRRIQIVNELKRHKDVHGIDFVDPVREQWMFAHQESLNEGPLSNEGLRAFYTELLALIKRETA